MKIKLSNAGKRFNREWIFRDINLEFQCGNAYAITGPNGSGKSTLLQTVGGMLQLSEGKMELLHNDMPLQDEQAYQHISFCAPYLEVIEEMTLTELLLLHQKFKPFMEGFTIQQIIEMVQLQAAAHKQIRYYSSGMKQRAKLAQALFSNTSVVLLDEPCSNLDEKGIELYHALIKKFCSNRLVIVCSNDPVEYSFCTTNISITDFKPAAIKNG